MAIGIDNSSKIIRVEPSDLSDGDILVWDSLTQGFVNARPRTKGDIGLGEGDEVRFSSIGGDGSGLTGLSLGQLAEVGDVSGAAEGQVLKFVNGQWVPGTDAAGDITALTAGSASIGLNDLGQISVLPGSITLGHVRESFVVELGDKVSERFSGRTAQASDVLVDAVVSLANAGYADMGVSLPELQDNELMLVEITGTNRSRDISKVVSGRWLKRMRTNVAVDGAVVETLDVQIRDGEYPFYFCVLANGNLGGSGGSRWNGFFAGNISVLIKRIEF